MTLKANQPVCIIGFPPNDELEGATGTILGITYSSYGTIFYIVGFDKPMKNGYTALSVISSCLKPI